MTDKSTWGLEEEAGEEEISPTATLEARLDELSFEDMRGMGLTLEALLEEHEVTDKIRARSKSELKTKVLEALAKLPEGHDLDVDGLIEQSKSPVTKTPIDEAVQEASDRATAAEESGSISDALRLSGASESPADAAPTMGGGEMSAPASQGAAGDEGSPDDGDHKDDSQDEAGAADSEPLEAEGEEESEAGEDDPNVIGPGDKLVWFLCHPMRYGIALRDIVVNPRFDFREYPHKLLTIDEMRKLMAQGYHWNKRVSYTPEKALP